MQFSEINVCRIYLSKRSQILHVIILINLSNLIRFESNTHIFSQNCFVNIHLDNFLQQLRKSSTEINGHYNYKIVISNGPIYTIYFLCIKLGTFAPHPLSIIMCLRETYYIVCQIDHINEYQYTLGFLFKSLCKQRLLVLHKILKKILLFFF